MVRFRIESPVIRLMAFVAVLHVAACTGRSMFRADEGASHEEAVRIANGNVTLAGTLVLPDGSQRHPAVVLFHGSGPQQRDLFTARWFAKHGVAALAYDKRGVGESTGNFRTVPFMELCGDGLAAIEYLKSRRDIDAKHIGVWGLSQGGWLGPLAASRSSDVAFVIAVSGPAVSPGEQMIFYYANELRARGLPESDVQEASVLRRDIWNYLSTGNDYDSAKSELNRARTKRWYNEVKSQDDGLFEPLPPPAEINRPDYRYTRWFKQEMNYDPVPALQTLHVPAVFLYGDEDRLVNVNETVAVLRHLVEESDNRDFTIRVFHHVGHDMHVTAGEKAGIIDPEYLDAMQTWLATGIR
jgi:dienelactone hydrolase